MTFSISGYVLNKVRNELISVVVEAGARGHVTVNIFPGWATDFVKKRLEEENLQIDEEKIKAIAIAMLNSIVEECFIDKSSGKVQNTFKGWLRYVEDLDKKAALKKREVEKT